MTKRTSKANALNKRKRNPMVPSTPRNRNKFSFDGSNLHATLYIGASITAAGIGSDFQQVGTDSTFGASRVMNSMVRQYREYRYRKITVTWIPSIGPASADAGGRIFMAITNNPEQMNFFQVTATSAQRISFAKGARNATYFNAWERVAWNVPLAPRKPWYDVNTIEAAYDVNVFDRAVQGMIVQGYESVSAAVILGTWKITFDLELRGLDIDTTAIV